MKIKWLINTMAISLLILVAILVLARHDAAMAAQGDSNKIEGILIDRFTTDGSADIIVRFKEQADLTPAYSMDWEARGDFVYNTLREIADRSQINAKAILDANGLSYQTFISGNDLYVFNGTMTDATALAALPEVASIRATRVYQVDPGLQVTNPLQAAIWAGDLLANHTLTTVGASPDTTIAWGLTDTKADQFWSTFGVKGQGIVVANIDTGVDYTHAALNSNYKCVANPSDPACWLDPGTQDCVGAGGGPCDSWVGTWHGTHVMGTEAGLDDPSLPYWVGMAPGAEWIACLGCPSGSCPDFDLNSCADWILAPNGNPANRPNVVNNSWGGGGGDAWYQASVQAWVAAGIFPAFSAGNSGSGCNTLGSPGDYQESFGSAAHDISRNIAGFSSRGPSVFGHTPYTKPNISSPGVNVLSTKPGNGWQLMSGTSMASPHTAGAVALLWSCNPALVGKVDLTFQALQESADPPPTGNCSAPPDGEGNYTYGYGYTDVLAAGISVCGGISTGTIEGHVYDQNDDPLQGAAVDVVQAPEGNLVQAVTDPDGYYTMTVVVGTYDATASKLNYTSETVPDVEIVTDTVTTVDFNLTYLGSWNLVSPLPAGCPNFTRFDMEYYEPTGKAYVLGGRGGADGTVTYGDIYTFDPIANNCTDTGVNMPTPISNYTIVPLNDGNADLLCTFGGRDAAANMTLVVQCYNPVANTVTTKANLPLSFTGYLPGGVAAIDNKVYIFGGFKATGTPYNTAITYEYDPLTNTYVAKGNLSQGRGYIDVAVVDGLIYGLGGDTSADGANLVASTRAESFDPSAGTWSDAAVADLPTATGEGRAFGISASSSYDQAGKIIVAGGGQWPADTFEVFSYDIASDTYDYSFPDLNVTRRNMAGFFIPGDPGQMWVFGGRSGTDLPPYALPEYYNLSITSPQPKIVVEPGSLHSTQLPDTTVTIPITISNEGTAPLDWSMVEGFGIQSIDVRPTPIAALAAPRQVNLSVSSHPVSGKMSNIPAIPQGAMTLTVDDGSAENSIGITDGTYSYQFIWLNRFTPSTTDFPFDLNQIQVLFPPDPVLEVGDDIDLVVYQDPDGNPANGAEWLATYPITVQAVDGVTWSVYDLPSPLRVSGPGDVLIGAISRYIVSGVTPASWPAAIDTDVSKVRSWAGWWNTDPPDPALLPPDYIFGTIDSFSFPGNWMIRGVGETVVDVPWLNETPTSGTLQPGEVTVIKVTFNSDGLNPGEYTAMLDILSNDQDMPDVAVPVSLVVEPVRFYLPITYK
jgi:subtilisin family serine protease